MNLQEKYNGLSPDGRKGVLLLLALIAAGLFLMLPAPSDLRPFLAPLRGIYSSATAPLPGKRLPFGGRVNDVPRTVFPQRGGEQPRPENPPSMPPTNGDARPSAPEAPNVAMPDGPMPVGLLGKYEGRTLLRKRKQVCIVSVELGAGGEGADQVAASSTMQCMDPLAPYTIPGAKTGPRDAIMAAAGRFLPVSSHLTGTWQNGALHLSVRKIVGDNDDCVMTSATLTPWSAQQVEFEWEDGCGKGDMLLAKTLK